MFLNLYLSFNIYIECSSITEKYPAKKMDDDRKQDELTEKYPI